MLLGTLEPKDVMAIMMLPSAAKKWNQMANDYSVAEHGIYLVGEGEGKVLHALYVDDSLIV